MKLESISTPLPLPSASPQQRYAQLHRSIEKGITSDETWSQLARVCVELGLKGEALTAFHNVRGTSERFHLQNLLLREGILREPDKELQRWAEGEDRPSLREDIEEAAAFLASDHMGITLVVTTATFPIVVGLSGYLTSGSSSELIRMLAIVPALIVLVAIGSLARRVLLDSSRGFNDVPDLPAPNKLGHEAMQFASEALPTALMLLGPAAGLFLLGAPWIYAMAALTVGALLLPMAWMLRTLRRDWASLGKVLWLATYRGGLDYASRALCVAILFTPAVGLLWIAGNAAVYLQLALVGPLLVAPMLFTARFMGRFLYAKRAALREFFEVYASGNSSASGTGELWDPEPAPATPAETANGPKKPKARRLKPAPEQSRPSQAASAAARPQQRPQRAQRQPAQREAAPAQRTPQRDAAAQRPAQREAAAAQRQAPARNEQPPRPVHREPPPAPTEAEWVGDPCIDLLSLPGARVLKGEARQRAGASPHAD